MKISEGNYALWKREEQASFSGWDFSYLDGRLEEEKPPWDYVKEARKLVKNATSVLDMGTGGGEILSTLAPFPRHTVATEGWLPNVSIAGKKLGPLGVKIVFVDESGKMPFKENEFDLVLNRQSDFDEEEVFRILQKNGIFFTQQVSGNNLRDLVEEFCVDAQFKDKNVHIVKKQLERIGFTVEIANEWKGKAEFKDVGAIVYFLKAIPWVVRNFTVDAYLPVLEKLQRKLDSGNKLSFTMTRFLLRARK